MLHVRGIAQLCGVVGINSGQVGTLPSREFEYCFLG